MLCLVFGGPNTVDAAGDRALNEPIILINIIETVIADDSFVSSLAFQTPSTQRRIVPWMSRSF